MNRPIEEFKEEHFKELEKQVQKLQSKNYEMLFTLAACQSYLSSVSAIDKTYLMRKIERIIKERYS